MNLVLLVAFRLIGRYAFCKTVIVICIIFLFTIHFIFPFLWL